jgi:anti-sigma regulatory factor (Ser/Thr protein kinase)
VRLLAPTTHFRHEAMFYASDDEFLDGTSSFIRDGLDNDEPTLVVLAAAKIEALRSELNGSADRVMFADMADVGANPARIIPAWNQFVAQHVGAGREIRGIGEPIWAERSPDELVEYQRHESLLNLAFHDTPGFFLLCPYDTEKLGEDVIEEAKRSHPFLCAQGHQHESTAYRGLDAVAAPFAAPLPEPISVPQSKIFQALTLGALRDFVAERGAAAGFEGQALDDLVIAVNEVATNSVVHAGGGGIARIWEDDGALVCEINDSGQIDRPMAGRETPGSLQQGGHGLWMANQLCDLVQLRTYDGGSAVRLHKRLG